MKFLAFTLLVILVACGEPIPVVKVGGGNPPSFVLKGRTDTLIFSIGGVDDHKSIDTQKPMWEIRNTDSPAGTPVNVVYGVIPAGFRQIIPEGDILPPSVVNGKKYFYWAQGFYGAKVGCFEFQQNKAREVACKQND
ncbi:MAG: hypothetical protein AB7U82_23700 [Blastocatellales bacterium]